MGAAWVLLFRVYFQHWRTTKLPGPSIYLLTQRPGKIAAQCSHATLACYKSLQSSPAGQSILKRWERLGQAKVALKVRSQEELEVLQAQAVSLGVCARIVLDAGRTQIEAGSATVLGVGPAPKGVVDRITGGLKLL